MKRIWRRWPAPLTLAALLIILLTACGTTRATGMRARSACIAFSPITFSAARDTAATVRQIREHNAAWEAVCRGPKQR